MRKKYRENTERPVTVEQGTNYLVGTDPAAILAASAEILSGRGKKGTVPPLWDGPRRRADRRHPAEAVNRRTGTFLELPQKGQT